MSVNNQRPHVLVLPEDEANEELVNGFLLDPSIKLRNIQVLPSAGGWSKVLDRFIDSHIAGLRQFKDRHLVLLVDFDDHVEERTAKFVAEFPADVRDRVFCSAPRRSQSPCAGNWANPLKTSGKHWQPSACTTKTPCGNRTYWHTTPKSAHG